jgi:hypothetical protein
MRDGHDLHVRSTQDSVDQPRRHGQVIPFYFCLVARRPSGHHDGVRGRSAALLVLLVGACGSQSGGAGVAATIDGQRWSAVGQGSEFTPVAGGPTTFTILGYTPLSPGSKQADQTKPQMEFVFRDIVPTAGMYPVEANGPVAVMYMPDRLSLYGGYEGNIQIVRITPDHADGTFDFKAKKAPDGTPILTFTDGSFSVPIWR